MNTIIDTLRSILGTPDFYIENGNYNSTWDYGAMLEYGCAVILLGLVIASVFKFIRTLIK